MDIDILKCQHCLKNNAEYECHDCYPPMICEPCEIILHSIPEIVDHHFNQIEKISVVLKENDHQISIEQNKELNIPDCDLHASEKLINKCQNCNQFVCKECLQNEIHQNHMIDYFIDSPLKSYQQIQTILTSCNNKVQKLEGLRQLFKTTSGKLAKEHVSTKGIVSNYFIKLEKCISESKAKALQSLDTYELKNQKYFIEINREIDELQNMFLYYLKKLGNYNLLDPLPFLNQNSTIENDLLNINRAYQRINLIENESKILSKFSVFSPIFNEESEKNIYFHIEHLLDELSNKVYSPFNLLESVKSRKSLKLIDSYSFQSIFQIVRKKKQLLNFEALKGREMSCTANKSCKNINCFNDPISQKFYYLSSYDESNDLYINEFVNCSEFFNTGIKKFRKFGKINEALLNSDNLTAYKGILYYKDSKDNVIVTSEIDIKQSSKSRFTFSNPFIQYPSLEKIISNLSLRGINCGIINFILLLSDQSNNMQFALIQLSNIEISLLVELIPSPDLKFGKVWMLPIKFGSRPLAFINDFILYYGSYENNLDLNISNAYDILDNNEKAINPLYLHGIRNLKNIFYVPFEEKLIIGYEDAICCVNISLIKNSNLDAQ